MRDVITAPGFVHLPPRERLIRHALNKVRDRVHPKITRRELEGLCARFAAGEFMDDVNEQGLDGRDVYRTRLWGQKVRVVFDVNYDAVVTVILGWETVPK